VCQKICLVWRARLVEGAGKMGHDTRARALFDIGGESRVYKTTQPGNCFLGGSSVKRLEEKEKRQGCVFWGGGAARRQNWTGESHRR
jgi:hypothetical protein